MSDRDYLSTRWIARQRAAKPKPHQDYAGRTRAAARPQASDESELGAAYVECQRLLIEARAAAAKSEAGAGLDVDALAVVLERMEIDCDPAANRTHSTCDHDDQAERLAAAYAEAASPRSDAGGEG